MNYDTNEDLPEQVRLQLTEDEQDVYRLAYNNSIAAGNSADLAIETGRRAVAMYRSQQRPAVVAD